MTNQAIYELGLPANTPLSKINDYVAEIGRAKRAVELGLPANTPLSKINDYVAKG